MLENKSNEKRDRCKLDTETVARMLADAGVPRSRELINKWCRRGTLEAYKDEGADGKEVWFINEDSVHRHITILTKVRGSVSSQDEPGSEGFGTVRKGSEHAGSEQFGRVRNSSEGFGTPSAAAAAPQTIEANDAVAPQASVGDDVPNGSEHYGTNAGGTVYEPLIQQLRDDLAYARAEKDDLLEMYAKQVSTSEVAHKEQEERIFALSQQVINMSVELRRLQAIEVAMKSQEGSFFSRWLFGKKPVAQEDPQQITGSSTEVHADDDAVAR